MANINQRIIASFSYSLLVLSIFLCGCSAPKLPVYPGSPATSNHVFNSEELMISAKPLFDSREITTYFGTDLTKENILPVFIKVKNKGSKGSYVVFHDKVFLNDSDDQMDAGDKQTTIDNTGSVALVAVGSVLICPPLLVAGVLTDVSRYSNAAEIKRNFKSKALQTQTLSGGETCSGFVYFRKPEDMKAPFITVEMKNLQNKQMQKVQIPISMEGEIK